jgi:hypothetical protein
MQKLIIILVLIITGSVTAQGNYEKGMQKAFELWKTGKTTEASNLFVRIAKAETDNWLPSYYAAYITVINGFGEKDKTKLTAQMEKAQNLINDASTASNDNPEIMVLQALKHTVWVAYDGATYGMKLGGTIAALYEKAIAIAPNNPRVVSSKAEWGIGGAKFFGQDTKPFCKELERSLELFANFKPESEFHPSWGEKHVNEVLSSCE